VIIITYSNIKTPKIKLKSVKSVFTAEFLEKEGAGLMNQAEKSLTKNLEVRTTSKYAQRREGQEHINFAGLLYLYADALFYPDKDFFKLLNELGLNNIIMDIKSLEEVQNQYVSLFEAKLGGVECIPFASFWYNKRLMGDEAIRLKRFYEKCGFKFNESDFKMPWDHIAIELSFLAKLIENKNYDSAKKMIKEHMGWVEKFKECLKTKNKTYYIIVTGVFELLNSFVEEG